MNKKERKIESTEFNSSADSLRKLNELLENIDYLSPLCVTGNYNFRLSYLGQFESLITEALKKAVFTQISSQERDRVLKIIKKLKTGEPMIFHKLTRYGRRKVFNNKSFSRRYHLLNVVDLLLRTLATKYGMLITKKVKDSASVDDF